MLIVTGGQCDYYENHINGSIEQTNVILQLIKNGEFDND